MFTKAFIDALLEGMTSRKSCLSLRDIKDLAMDRLSEMQNAPKPVVLSPDQSEGDIADIPFFPNPKAEQIRRAEEEARADQIEKEQSAALSTSVADFTVSPTTSKNITLVRNDSTFRDNHSFLDRNGQVVADFNLQASMKTVKVTIRGLVSRLEPSKGYAPISLLYNGQQFLQDFNQPGGGFDPNDTTFQVPPRLLTPGTSKLTLQVSPNAQSHFWLYRLEIQQSA